MELNHIYGLLVTIMVTSVCSQSITDLADRQYQLTVDTLSYCNDQLIITQHNLQLAIARLEERIALLESRPVSAAAPQSPLVEEVPGETGEVPHKEEGNGDGERGGETGDKGAGELQHDNENANEHAETEAPPPPPTTQVQTTTKPVTFAKFPEYEATCAHIYQNGYTTSGDYTIDPDGFGVNEAFTVYCDMDNGQGITMVGHDTETENIPINGFEDPGSFILEPQYGNDITMQQLGALADVSFECEQYVKYACKNSGLMEISKKTGTTYAWWVDRRGRTHVNFGGAPTDSGLCACGVTQTCFNGSPTCNCDHKNAKNQVDEGSFNDKATLPVMTLNLGDTGSKKERAAVTLGKFICKG